MHLFKHHQFQKAIWAFTLVLSAHVALKFIPQSPLAYALAEMFLVFLSLAALTTFILLHHRQAIMQYSRSRILNQGQEEALLVGAFGLFWFSLMLGIRAWNTQISTGSSDEATPEIGSSETAPEGVESTYVRPFNAPGCPGGTLMCVIQELSW